MNDADPRLVIARASLDDLDVVVALFDAYRVFYRQPSDPEAARTFMRARLEDGDSTIFVAYGAGERAKVPLGFTQLYPSFSSVSMKPLWILNDLYVAPVARKQGVARALLDRARQLASDTGARGLILETAVDNQPAQRLYERYGFRRDTDFYRYALETDSSA